SSFRIGGDEFALLLPQTDSAQASALSRRIGVVFAELLRPLALDIGVSIDHGVATYPQDSDQREQLVRIADERLYHFKHAERRNGLGGAGATSLESPEAVEAAAVPPAQPFEKKAAQEVTPHEATEPSLASKPVTASEEIAAAEEASPPTDTSLENIVASNETPPVETAVATPQVLSPAPSQNQSAPSDEPKQPILGRPSLLSPLEVS